MCSRCTRLFIDQRTQYKFSLHILLSAMSSIDIKRKCYIFSHHNTHPFIFPVISFYHNASAFFIFFFISTLFYYFTIIIFSPLREILSFEHKTKVLLACRIIICTYMTHSCIMSWSTRCLLQTFHLYFIPAIRTEVKVP